VTRRTVIEIAEAEGIPVEEGTYAPDAVREADGFLTNSTWEIRPVETVDGIGVDGDGEGVEGPLTARAARGCSIGAWRKRTTTASGYKGFINECRNGTRAAKGPTYRYHVGRLCHCGGEPPFSVV